jgi:hypothetical protein
MRCTQYTVLHLQSHAVLKTRAVQSHRPGRGPVGPIWRYSHRPGPVGPIWRYARTARARACGTATFHNTQQRTEYTQTGRHRYRRVDVQVHTDPRPRLPEYIHAFPRPVSISHVQPYTDSAAGRPDPDTRQRAVGYDTADRRIACLPCCLHSSGVVEHPHAPGRGQMLQVLHATIVPGQTRETGGAS